MNERSRGKLPTGRGQQGQVTVEYEGGQRQDFHAGDFIVEAIGVWHFGTNTGTVPLRLLVIDQVEAGKPNTILAN